MLEVWSRVLGKIRRCRLTRLDFKLILFLALIFLVIPKESLASGLEDTNVDRYDLNMVEDDTLAIYIDPILGYVLADCNPLDYGSPFDLTILSNHTSTLFGETTAIWMTPESQGRYNFTITFQSTKPWNYTIGVYAQELDFYLDLYGTTLSTYGFFAALHAPYTRVSGNWTINILVTSHSRSSPSFIIQLPTPLNSILLVTVSGFIVYFNAFLLMDTYFKDKKEIVSNRRWFLAGIVIVVSAIAIYLLYNFTTFTLSRGI